MFTEEELKRILDGARDEAIAQTRNTLVNSVTSKIKYELEDKIKATVLEWFAAEMKPAIITTLEEQREMIAQTSVLVAKEVSEATAKAIASQFAQALAGEYQRREFLKAALGLK